MTVITVEPAAKRLLFTDARRRGKWSIQWTLTHWPLLCVKIADNCNENYSGPLKTNPVGPRQICTWTIQRQHHLLKPASIESQHRLAHCRAMCRTALIFVQMICK